MGGAGTARRDSRQGWRGRTREWGVVTGLLDAAQAGRGGVLLVDGPSGIGKSSLLTEALDAAAERGFMVARGCADELGRLVPLAPLTSALGVPVRAPGADVDDLRLWLVDRLRARLEDRLADRAMLITLDDLQWADPMTLLALRSLIPELSSYALVWMLARMSGGDGDDVERLFAMLERQGARRMVLEALPCDAVAEIAADVLGAPPSSDLLALTTRAGGNPFLVVELLGGLRDEDAVEVAGGQARLISAKLPRLPQRVQAVARNRLAGLSPAARRLLQVGAVLGRSFALDDLADMLGEPASRLLPAIEEALAAHIVVPGEDEFVFRHQLIWQAVTDSLSAPVRRWLHRQAGEMLLGRGGSVVQAAAHFMVHARPGDRGALLGLDRAAREILPSSPQTAAEIGLRALDLTEPADPARFDRTVAAAGALITAGRLSEATELACGALAHAPGERLGELRYQRAVILLLTGRAEDAVTEAEDILGQKGLSPEARDAVELTWFAGLILKQDVTPGLRRAQEIVAARDRHCDTAVAGAHFLLVHTTWADGRVADGFDHLREAARISGGGSLGVHSPVARLFLAAGLACVREFEEAEAILRVVDEEIAAMGHTAQAAGAAFVRACVSLLAGRTEDAAAEATAGLELADELGTHAFTRAGFAVLAIVALRSGEVAEATRYMERYRGRAEQGIAFPAGWGTWAEAMVAEARGGPERAMEVFDAESAEDWLRGWHLLLEPNLAPWVTRTALAAGDRARAELVVGVSERLARDNPEYPALTAAAAHAGGIVHGDATALAYARAHTRDPWGRASAAEDLGVLLVATDRNQAVGSLDEALDGYERVGAVRDAARVRARLRRLGVRRRHWTQSARPVAGWAGLTDTERSVATLVAQGLTNRQVAGEMFLSPHTVKFHLRQVFRKLDIGSRVELARAAAEYGEGTA
jgi:DNA-binding CsgD family transcriptional regulator